MKRILAVEDNADNLYLITFILRHAGYEVLETRNGEDAVDVAAGGNLDLIIMDVQLPGIDGLETTRRIRGTSAGGAVPIVALTSFAMAGDRKRALEAGCTGYIEKPINPDTFLQDLRSYL